MDQTTGIPTKPAVTPPPIPTYLANNYRGQEGSTKGLATNVVDMTRYREAARISAGEQAGQPGNTGGKVVDQPANPANCGGGHPDRVGSPQDCGGKTPPRTHRATPTTAAHAGDGVCPTADRGCVDKVKIDGVVGIECAPPSTDTFPDNAQRLEQNLENRDTGCVIEAPALPPGFVVREVFAPLQERYTVEQIARAIIKCGGWLAKAAEVLGCTYKTIWRYSEKYPELKELIEDVKNRQLDEVEEKLLGKVRAGDVTACIWWLKCQGKGRGWVERQEWAGVEDKPITLLVVPAFAPEPAMKELSDGK